MSTSTPETEASPADNPLVVPEPSTESTITGAPAGSRRTSSGLLSDPSSRESSFFGSATSISSDAETSLLDPLAATSTSSSAEEDEQNQMRILEEAPEAEQPLLNNEHTPEEGNYMNSQKNASYKPRSHSRVGSACKFVCVGLALSAAALGILIYQERHAVNLQEYYQHAQEIVQEIISDTDSTSTFGLVHITGDAVVQASSDASSDFVHPQDNETGISTNGAIKLLRSAQMWQWVESDDLDKHGDYTYDLEWFSTYQDSNDFIEEHHPTNPPSMPYEDHAFLPSNQVQILNNQWILSSALLKIMDVYQVLDLKQVQIDNTNDAMKSATVQEEADGTTAIYIPFNNENKNQSSRNPAQDPQLGDTRIQYKIIPEQKISIVALWNDTSRQLEGYQEKWMSRAAKPLLLVRPGSVSAQQMLNDAWKEEQPHLFVLRIGCGVLLYLGLLVLAKPLSILEDLVPQLQDVVGPDFVLHIALVGMAPISLAVIGSTMALCWLGTHPGLSSLYFILQAIAVYHIGRKMAWWVQSASPLLPDKNAVQEMEKSMDGPDAQYQLVPEEATCMELNEV